MKHKLSSRKWWAWVIGQIIVLIAAFGLDTPPEIKAILLTTGSAFLAGAYQVVEGLVDRKKVNNEEITELVSTVLELSSKIEALEKRGT